MLLVYDVTDLGSFDNSLPQIKGTVEDILELIDCHHQLGFWRTDFASGHVHFSPQTWRIYGLEPRAEAVNLIELNQRVHPEDLPLCLSIFETSARERTGFQYVLRISDGQGGYKFVRSVGQYRDTPGGAGETVGIFHEIFHQP